MDFKHVLIAKFFIWVRVGTKPWYLRWKLRLPSKMQNMDSINWKLKEIKHKFQQISDDSRLDYSALKNYLVNLKVSFYVNP